MPAAGDPLLGPREVVVVEAEPPAHRLAVGEVEHLRGGHPPAGEVEQLGHDAEDRVGLAQRAVGQADAQVCARRRRPRRLAAPNVAWISGANASMSGHMTMTSRGSSVGSSSSACRIASRSTSTWRARPWQAWTWMLRSCGPGAGSGSGRRSSRTAGLDALQQRLRARRDRVVVVCARGRPAQLQLAGVAAPGGEQRVADLGRGRVVGAADGAGPAQPLPQRGRGVQQEEVDVACVRQRLQDLELGAGKAGEAEDGQSRREVEQARVGAQARAGGQQPLGRARHVRAPRAAGATARACQCAWPPAAHARTSSGRCSA